MSAILYVNRLIKRSTGLIKLPLRLAGLDKTAIGFDKPATAAGRS